VFHTSDVRRKYGGEVLKKKRNTLEPTEMLKKGKKGTQGAKRGSGREENFLSCGDGEEPRGYASRLGGGGGGVLPGKGRLC